MRPFLRNLPAELARGALTFAMILVGMLLFCSAAPGQATLSRNSKSETRNPKQIPMTKNSNEQNLSPGRFGTLGYWNFEFVADFEFRISSFEAKPGQAVQPAWIDLMASDLSAWKEPHSNWMQVSAVELDPKNDKKFVAKEGKGVWYNGPKGGARDLYSKQKFADVELHLEFNIPKGSNSGIKFHGHYEIQIFDSFGKKTLTGGDCGGIYPRSDAKPTYHRIDDGVAPKVNACKQPGEWQTLDITFLAPRFDDKGKKIANAKIVRAVLNGRVIHENQEVPTPTGDRWRNPEMREGPLMVQSDHGPVAFRNMRVRPLEERKK